MPAHILKGYEMYPHHDVSFVDIEADAEDENPLNAPVTPTKAMLDQLTKDEIAMDKQGAVGQKLT